MFLISSRPYEDRSFMYGESKSNSIIAIDVLFEGPSTSLQLRIPYLDRLRSYHNVKRKGSGWNYTSHDFRSVISHVIGSKPIPIHLEVAGEIDVCQKLKQNHCLIINLMSITVTSDRGREHLSWVIQDSGWVVGASNQALCHFSRLLVSCYRLITCYLFCTLHLLSLNPKIKTKKRKEI